MKPIAILSLALAASTAAGLVFAQQSGSTQPTQGQQHSDQHRGQAKLDTNGDGAIDRSEAAANPRLAAKFDQLDSNNDGRLEASERPQRKAHQGRGHQGKGHGKHGGSGDMARLDTNGDGRISRDEVAAKPMLVEKFTEIDLNGDGYLVRTEVTIWFERMRPQRQAERNKRFQERFTAADLNGDGKLSKIEVSEKMTRMADSFAWMDENRDGFLSQKELQPPQR